MTHGYEKRAWCKKLPHSKLGVKFEMSDQRGYMICGFYHSDIGKVLDECILVYKYITLLKGPWDIFISHRIIFQGLIWIWYDDFGLENDIETQTRIVVLKLRGKK